MSSAAVMADAQFGIAKVFRPFSGFETAYQGVSGFVPIAIPGSLDPNAGKPGYDPDLIQGIPVPLGARVLIYLPTITIPVPVTPGRLALRYQYYIGWRLRNLQDYRRDRVAYHFPQQSLGENDQYVIPAALKPILYDSSKQKLSATGYGVSEVVPDTFLPTGFLPFAPLSPRSTATTQVKAAVQQGIADTESNNTISFSSVQYDAEGDEMMLYVSKTDVTPWNFSSVTPYGAPSDDRAFSNFYGSGSGREFKNLGVYVFTGSNP